MTTVGELFETVGGGTPDTRNPAFWHGTIPWVTSADLGRDGSMRPRRTISIAGVHGSAATVVPAKTVVVAIRVGLGKVAIASDEMAFSQDCQGLLPAPDLASEKFTFYQMGYRASQLKLASRGTTISGVPKTALLRLPFSLPPLAEQHRIVEAIEEKFSRIDVGTAALGRIRRALQRARSATVYAGVTGQLMAGSDSEPVRIPADEVDGSAKGRRGRILGGPAQPRPAVPPNWQWIPWRRLGASKNGRAFPSSQYCDDGVRLLRPGNLHVSGDVRWATENTRHLPDDWRDKAADLIVGPGELIVNLTAQSLADDFLGRICVTGEGESLLNQRLARLTALRLNTRYAFWVFKSPIFRQFVNGLNTGSLIQHMFTWQLDLFELPVPPEKDQLEIVESLDRLNSVFNRVEDALLGAERRGRGLRRAILSSAFSGELVDQDPADQPVSTFLKSIEGPDAVEVESQRSSQQTADVGAV